MTTATTVNVGDIVTHPGKPHAMRVKYFLGSEALCEWVDSGWWAGGYFPTGELAPAESDAAVAGLD